MACRRRKWGGFDSRRMHENIQEYSKCCIFILSGWLSLCWLRQWAAGSTRLVPQQLRRVNGTSASKNSLSLGTFSKSSFLHMLQRFFQIVQLRKVLLSRIALGRSLIQTTSPCFPMRNWPVDYARGA